MLLLKFFVLFSIFKIFLIKEEGQKAKEREGKLRGEGRGGLNGGGGDEREAYLPHLR